MEMSILASSVFTVVAFVSFVGIVAWAYSTRPRQRFDAAANAPFAVPDELDHVPARTPGQDAARSAMGRP